MVDFPLSSANPFEERFVAFVDILGFSDIVKRMQHDNGLFIALRDALVAIDAQSQGLDEYRQFCKPRTRSGSVSMLPRSDVTMTAFSDCYLISEKASDEEGENSPWHVMAAVQALGSNLLAKDILTRGAVVRGYAYHQDRVAFGPAIIDAYDIEKNVSKYPRILVTDEVREAISWDDKTFWNGQLLLKDIDGCSFINVLTPPLSKWATISNDTTSLAMTEFLSHISSLLMKRLEHLSDTKTPYGDAAGIHLRQLSKLTWLIHHFNATAQLHGLATIEPPTP